jgi:hypothetical protein
MQQAPLVNSWTSKAMPRSRTASRCRRSAAGLVMVAGV